MEATTKIKFVISIVLAIGISYLALQTIIPDSTNIGIANESVTWAANETWVSLAHHPIYLASPYLPTLTYANGTTAVSNKSFSANGRAYIGFNIPAAAYYAHYTYYNEPWLAGTNYAWMLSILMFVMAFAVLMKFTGLI